MIFFDGRAGKASQIFSIFSMLDLVTWANDLLAIVNFDLASTVALGCRGMGERTLETLFFMSFPHWRDLAGFLDCLATAILKERPLVFTGNLSHPDLYIADSSSQAENSNSCN